ncbi:MAG: SRPBCC family protein [Saprospiraceae bacterium]
MAKFNFITRWNVGATVDEAYSIIKDSSALKKWWPSVYLDVKVTDQGLNSGIGKKVALWTKGFLPYTLQWNFEVVQIIPKERIVLNAYGDLLGKGIWTFKKTSFGCEVVFEWSIDFDKKYLSAFSPVLRPVFGWNHRWAMNKGLESLKLEVLRRRGVQHVDAPPRPTWPHRNS